MNDTPAPDAQAGPLPERIEAIRRRWATEWSAIPHDEGMRYVFAMGDIKDLLDGYDAANARIAELEAAQVALKQELARWQPNVMSYESGVLNTFQPLIDTANEPGEDEAWAHLQEEQP